MNDFTFLNNIKVGSIDCIFGHCIWFQNRFLMGWESRSEARLQANDIHTTLRISFGIIKVLIKADDTILSSGLFFSISFHYIIWSYIKKPATIAVTGGENGLLTVCKNMAQCSTTNPSYSSALFTLTWMQSHSRSLNWGSVTTCVLICVLAMKGKILSTVWTFYFNYNNVHVSGRGSCAAAPRAQRDFSSSIECGEGGWKVGHNKHSPC